MQHKMNIEIEELSEYTIISLAGRIDASNHEEILESIEACINSGCVKLIVNAEDLNYLSSAGLRVFIRVQKLLANKQESLRLCCLSEAISEIFNIAGFTSIFAIYDTLEDALNSWS